MHGYPGGPGVVLVTSGPGATNTVTGIADAYMDSTPMVVLSGQVSSAMLGNDAFSRGGCDRHYPAVHQTQLPGPRLSERSPG